MAKFNPTITAYLVPYIREGYDKKICYFVRLLLKVEHISYCIPWVLVLSLSQANAYISGKALV